jgi:hypothetical protein
MILWHLTSLHLQFWQILLLAVTPSLRLHIHIHVR